MKPLQLSHLMALWLTICACQAQRVALPDSTSAIEPGAAWTVLGQAELDADSRASDPATEPARAMLLDIIATLREQAVTSSHLLLHSEGNSPVALRLAHTYAAEGGATINELLTDASVRGCRDVLEPALAAGGREVTWIGATRQRSANVDYARLSFTIKGGGMQLAHDHCIVPAGDRLRYFDCTFDEGDDTARSAFGSLIETFDGSSPPPAGPGSLWIAGIAGALAGVMTALFRRKRQAQLLAAKIDAER